MYLYCNSKFIIDYEIGERFPPPPPPLSIELEGPFKLYVTQNSQSYDTPLHMARLSTIL